MKTREQFDAMVARGQRALDSFRETSALLEAKRAKRILEIEVMMLAIENSVEGLAWDTEEYVIADSFLAMYKEQLDALRK